MPCTCGACAAYESAFDRGYAEGDLKAYLRHGPSKQTRGLIDAVTALVPPVGASVLDIGGGVGVIQLELLKRGASRAVDVDGSSAFIAVARAEAARQGFDERTAYLHGDAVALAAQVPPADIVTLDRVICCYPDMPALVGLAAARTQHALGLVWPREAWWMHGAVAIFNLSQRFRQFPLTQHLHHFGAVDAVAQAHGLSLRVARDIGLWQLRIYARVNPGT